MSSKKPSLIEFAKQFERPSCIACSLPEREEMDAAYRSGVTRKTILRWLWDVKGYNDKSGWDEEGLPNGLSPSMLDKHFSQSHHFNKEQ